VVCPWRLSIDPPDQADFVEIPAEFNIQAVSHDSVYKLLQSSEGVENSPTWHENVIQKCELFPARNDNRLRIMVAFATSENVSEVVERGEWGEP
jgi:hypothetical protein